MRALITVTAHNDRVNLIHIRNDVSITKSTHAGRPFAAQTARAHGASVDGTKALGGWSESGSFRPCYDRAFPADALLGAGMFSAQKPESYCLPRNALGAIFSPSVMVFFVPIRLSDAEDEPFQNRLRISSRLSSHGWKPSKPLFMHAKPVVSSQVTLP